MVSDGWMDTKCDIDMGTPPKKFGDSVSNEIVKKTVCNKLNTKVNNLEKKFLIKLLEFA